jgi:putative transposase
MRRRDDGCNAIQSRLRVIGAEVSASRSTEPASLWVPKMSFGFLNRTSWNVPERRNRVMALSFLYLAFVRVLQLFRLVRHDNEELAVEVVMLRHEIAVLRRQVARPALRSTDRAVLAGLSRLFDRRRPGRFFVRPGTLLRWHRDLVRRRWSEPHGPGSRSIPAGTVAIILRFARENPAWGDGRIQGEPSRLGVVLAPSSVWAFLRRDGIDPSPMRAGPSWTEFLRTQPSSVLACDFFSVDTVLLKRLYVLFFIELDPRRVYVTGVTANPIGAWVVQQARNLSMVLVERVHPVRLLVRYRATEFTQQFDEFFRAEGVRAIRTPVRAPRANALAERFVGTVRREGLDRMLIFGRRHLERVLVDHVAHYDEHRPHRALGQQPPLGVDEPLLIVDPEPSQLRRRDTVFGLIHEYQLAV